MIAKLFQHLPPTYALPTMLSDFCQPKGPKYISFCFPFQALSVGIFPYVLKLLQSSARELRPLLVFIWAKILAVDSVCPL